MDIVATGRVAKCDSAALLEPINLQLGKSTAVFRFFHTADLRYSDIPLLLYSGIPLLLYFLVWFGFPCSGVNSAFSLQRIPALIFCSGVPLVIVAVYSAITV